MSRKILLPLLFLLALLLWPQTVSAQPAADDTPGILPALHTGYPAADRLLHLCDSLYSLGVPFATNGYTRIADWYIGQSVTAVSAFRGAVNDFYYDRKKEAEAAETDQSVASVKESLGIDLSALLDFADMINKAVDKMTEDFDAAIPGDKLTKYDNIWWPLKQNTNLVSPYGLLFRGLVLECHGDMDGAVECYAKAIMNPFLDPELVDFTFIADLGQEELLALSRLLSGRENDYRTLFTDSFYFDQPALLPWSAEYHRAMATEAIMQDEPDYRRALSYCEAALHVDPFDPVNYENVARLCIVTGNYLDLGRYVAEGLSLDPGNGFLLEADALFKKYQKK